MKKLVLLLVAILLTGCVEKEIIDDINIEVAVGYDKADDREGYKGTVLFQQFQPDQSVQNVTYTGEGKLRQDLLLEATKQSSEPVVTGGLKLAIFGPELVKEGIYDLVDSFQRDASIGARLFLATSEGKSGDLLKGEYGTRGNSTYIYNLISHNVEKRDIPKTNLHLAARDFYQKGKDLFLPRLKQAGQDKVEIVGISLFQKDKEVDILPVDKMFFFKLLVDKYSEGNFDVKTSEKARAAIQSIRSKHKIKVSNGRAKINIEIYGIIREYTGKALTPEIIKEVEKKLEDQVERESVKLLKRFQELGIDPVGFGQMMKQQERNFDFNKWEDEYKQLTFDVKCDVVIGETGVIE